MAAVLAVTTGSVAVAAPHPVAVAEMAGKPNQVQEASIASKKAATKAWFKRKGNQVADWFGRQKDKVERKLSK